MLPRSSIAPQRSLTVGLLGLFFCIGDLAAQNVAINPAGSAPANVALLDLKDNPDKGLLLPRIALTRTDVAAPVPAPATGLLIYNTATSGLSGANAQYNVTPGFYSWDGARWVAFAALARRPFFLQSTGTTTTTGTNNWITVNGLQTAAMWLRAGDRVELSGYGTVTTQLAGHATARFQFQVDDGGGFVALPVGGQTTTMVDNGVTLINAVNIPTYIAHQSWGITGYYDVPADGNYTFALRLARSAGTANLTMNAAGSQPAGMKVEVVRP